MQIQYQGLLQKAQELGLKISPQKIPQEAPQEESKPEKPKKAAKKTSKNKK